MVGSKDKAHRCLKICVIFLIGWEIASAGSSPQELLGRIDEAMYPSNIVYTAEMRIYRRDKENIKRMKVYIKGKDKALVEFLYPKKERGVKILMRGEYAWMYLPSVEKIIRLSGGVSLAGGDFIHQDIMKVRLEEDYEVVSLKEEEDHSLLELRAKRRGVYDKIVYWVKKDLLPIKTEFYVCDDRLLKTLSYKEPKLMKGRLMPSVLVMQNAFTQEYKTILKIEDVDLSPIPDRVFTQEYLGKGL